MELVNGSNRSPGSATACGSRSPRGERLELFVPICRRKAVQHAPAEGDRPPRSQAQQYDGHRWSTARPGAQEVIDSGVAKATAGGLTDQSLDANPVRCRSSARRKPCRASKAGPVGDGHRHPRRHLCGAGDEDPVRIAGHGSAADRRRAKQAGRGRSWRMMRMVRKRSSRPDRARKAEHDRCVALSDGSEPAAYVELYAPDGVEPCKASSTGS